ncbi:glycosyltransferase [Actinomadura sp. OS1-43]|uniref:glycosyltransferase family 2 protein n=1 Tax=Actinomadura sp. OS1-43 TaxID=604315 RepID=UPI00255B21A6|nr:glycosyltransferase [Actinomadura sp. OS1-43]MDL4813622.1 glycosyltransferase [Actinomadura sp. OS1-43]
MSAEFRAPTARYAPPRTRIMLAALPLAGFAAWAMTHLVAVVTTFRTPFGATCVAWTVSLLALWWIPVSWLERPFRASGERRAALDALTVAVQVPVYNEDPAALRACLRSVLDQSRRVDRVHVVDDGSADADGNPVAFDAVRRGFEDAARALGIETTWRRTPNRGKRFAQMHALAGDDADVFVTLDSDSVLDRHAVREGLLPFADPRVQSVGGHVLVLNRTASLLTRMTCVLYLPFTRGVRSAQSVLRRVTINSGTLAFYRGEVVRRAAGVYEHERFAGRPMQMNDDSMLTFYALLAGDTVHQPSSMAFTLVPERLDHYLKQQLRWMRGTTVRHLWWLRYMPVTGAVFWMTVSEYLHLVLALLLPSVLLVDPAYRAHFGAVASSGVQAGIVLSYLSALRIFTVRRSDEPVWARAVLFACTPLIALWRLFVLRPLYLYAMCTCRRVGDWGTRKAVEVSLAESR